jgi:hypothetical protein
MLVDGAILILSRHQACGKLATTSFLIWKENIQYPGRTAVVSWANYTANIQAMLYEC